MPFLDDLELRDEELKRLQASMGTQDATQAAPIEIPEMPDPSNNSPSEPKTATEMIKAMTSDPETLRRLREDATAEAPWMAGVLRFFPRLRGVASSMSSAHQRKKAEALGQLQNMQQQENYERDMGLKEAANQRAEAGALRDKEKFIDERISQSLANDPEGAQYQYNKSQIEKLAPSLVQHLGRSGGEELGILSKQLNDSYQKELINKRAMADMRGDNTRQSEINQRQFNTLVDSGRRRLESNTKAFREGIMATDDLNALSDLMRQGNTVAASTYAAKYARGVAREVGVLTESDLTRYTNSRQLIRSIMDKMSTWSTGAPSNATIEELEILTKALSDKTNKHIQSFANQEIERMSKSTGRDIQEISDYLGYNYDPSVPAYGKKSKEEKTIDPSNSGLPPDKQKRLEELRIKKAGK